MKPLNEHARKQATLRFIGMYAFSLLVVLLLSFFLFSSPVKIYRKEANNYHQFVEQYHSLNSRASRATAQINDLVEVQRVISMNPSRGLDSMVKKYNDGIRKEVISLQTDSANNSLPLLQDDLRNYLAAFNAILYYTENNGSAKPQIIINDDDDKTKFIGQLQTENLDLRNAMNSLKEEIRILRSSTPQSGTNRNEALILQGKLSAAEKDRDRYKATATQLQESVRTKDGQISNMETQIAGLNNRLRNAGNAELSEEEKAKLLYQSVAQVIRRSRNEQKGVYKGLKDILISIQNTYPDKNQINQRIKELNSIISSDF